MLNITPNTLSATTIINNTAENTIPSIDNNILKNPNM